VLHSLLVGGELHHEQVGVLGVSIASENRAMRDAMTLGLVLPVVETGVELVDATRAEFDDLRELHDPASGLDEHELEVTDVTAALPPYSRRAREVRRQPARYEALLLDHSLGREQRASRTRHRSSLSAPLASAEC